MRVAAVTREAYPDATAKEGDWSAVDLAPVKPLKNPVTLDEIKTHPELKTMSLVRLSRLSVHELSAEQFRATVKLGR